MSLTTDLEAPAGGAHLAPARSIDVYAIAAEHADTVDTAARFPHEAIDALREVGFLGALVPVELGGLGLDLAAVCEITRRLGRECSSAGMVFAMHQIQVASLIRHGRSGALRTFVRRVAEERLLLASATTEINIGGNTRSSACAVERVGDGVHLVKHAPVISYGLYADAVLATARRDVDSAANDQVLVLCPRDGLTLEEKSGWDTLGFRGTCSSGFLLTATTTAAHVLDDPFGDISSHTMLPVSHLLWSSLWLGMAESAEAKARSFVQQQARKSLGTVPPGALRLAELHMVLMSLRESVLGTIGRYEAIAGDPNQTAAVGFALALNTLKISASAMVVDIVTRALAICGISGYRSDSSFSLGRVLRDAHGAALMVSNDRIAANNAQLLLMFREQ